MHMWPYAKCKLLRLRHEGYVEVRSTLIFVKIFIELKEISLAPEANLGMVLEFKCKLRTVSLAMTQANIQ